MSGRWRTTITSLLRPSGAPPVPGGRARRSARTVPSSRRGANKRKKRGAHGRPVHAISPLVLEEDPGEEIDGVVVLGCTTGAVIVGRPAVELVIAHILELHAQVLPRH